MDALIGHTGFVGGNLLRQHTFGAQFNSRNIQEIRRQSFRTLVFSGAQAKKWWANAHAEADWQGIATALDAIDTVRAEHVVLISTVDVVPSLRGADESFECHSVANHPYGVNRLRLEDAVRARFPASTIVRLPALFGHGLRKNVVFDLLNANMLDKINPGSCFQYYDLDRLWADIATARREGIGLVHLVTAPVSTADIIGRFFPDSLTGPLDAGSAIAYDLRTRHSQVFGGADGYIYDGDEVLRRLAAFVDRERSGAVG